MNLVKESEQPCKAYTSLSTKGFRPESEIGQGTDSYFSF